MSREGSVQLRRALIDLGIGLWHADPAARRYGQQLRARGKKGGAIGCAMANRANKIAYLRSRISAATTPTAGPDRTRDCSITAYSVAHSSGQSGAPAAHGGRTRLTAASSDAQSVGEESRKGAYLAPRSRAFCEGVALHRGMSNVRAVHVEGLTAASISSCRGRPGEAAQVLDCLVGPHGATVWSAPWLH
jgi:hypothetical protein